MALSFAAMSAGNASDGTANSKTIAMAIALFIAVPSLWHALFLFTS
jgi:hypothetical protein